MKYNVHYKLRGAAGEKWEIQEPTNPVSVERACYLLENFEDILASNNKLVKVLAIRFEPEE